MQRHTKNFNTITDTCRLNLNDAISLLYFNADFKFHYISAPEIPGRISFR